MNGSSFEPTRIILVAYAAWLRSRFGFAVANLVMNGSSFEPILGSFWSRMLLVTVQSSSMLERLRRICCKSPHVSAMLFQHMIFPSIERNWSIMHVDPRTMKQSLLARFHLQSKLVLPESFLKRRRG